MLSNSRPLISYSSRLVFSQSETVNFWTHLRGQTRQTHVPISHHKARTHVPNTRQTCPRKRQIWPNASNGKKHSSKQYERTFQTLVKYYQVQRDPLPCQYIVPVQRTRDSASTASHAAVHFLVASTNEGRHCRVRCQLRI